MVKLDVGLMRFLEEEDYRVLTSLELSMRNHEIAPTALVERIAELPHGGVKKRLNNLLKHKVIHHETAAFDGYSMKYQAYDFLALRTFSKRGTVSGVGSRIGCGKESDIIHVEDENKNEAVMKLQRLGRCSFRTVTRNRDYKNGKARRGASWFYLSRLAAQKEFAFMKMLYDEGFPVPKPLDQNRHAVVMEYVDGILLNHIQVMPQAQLVYQRCLSLMVKLAEHGLIHGDFNEFNVLVTEPDLRIVLIDFPQMVSTDHFNAAELFARDVDNLANFFRRRFRIESVFYPTLEKDVERVGSLDRKAMASGFFTARMQDELERLMEDQKKMPSKEDDDDDEDDDEEDEDDEEEEEGSEAPTAAASGEGPNKSSRQERHGAVLALTKPGAGAAVADGDDEQDAPDPDAEAPATDVKPEDEKSSAPAPKARRIRIVAKTKNGTTMMAVGSARQETAEGGGDNDDAQSVITTTTTFVTGATSVSGGINLKEVNAKVKQLGVRAEDRDFHRNLHRNCQKGREKLKISRHLQNHRDEYLD